MAIRQSACTRFRHHPLSRSRAKNENVKRPITIPPNLLKQVPELGISSYKAAYVSIVNRKRQRLLVKLLTDRLTLCQLENRGFQTEGSNCRRGCGVTEDLSHFFGSHILPEIENVRFFADYYLCDLFGEYIESNIILNPVSNNFRLKSWWAFVTSC